MQMLVWESEYLRRYGQGLIIVHATDVEGARKKAWERFAEWDREHYWFDHENGDEDAQRAIGARQRLFAEDLAASPMLGEVMFIQGSE